MSALAPLGDHEAYVTTKDAWHALAEHVLAAARHRATGRIGLQITPGGFGTPPFDGRSIAVDGGELVLSLADEEQREPITTLRVAADLVGIEAGAPRDVYTPSTPFDPDAPLRIDLDAARGLAAWGTFAQRALEQIVSEVAAEAAPSAIQLWPEHFDLATEIGDEARGARGTFGASPGDAVHPEPYLYVTHWADTAPDPYWNDAAFPGASLAWSALAHSAAPLDVATDFFRRGHQLLDHPHP